MKIFENQKHVFWQALLLAIFVFAFGILIGFWIENSRISKISDLYVNAELEMLDIQIQSDLIAMNKISCSNSIQENIAFADRIYAEAKLLEKYESASRISDAIRIQHKKYDLLRTLLWTNSMKTKQYCNASYHNLVYLYDYNEPSIDSMSKQDRISRVLEEVKNDFGNSVMLIPISGDNGISSLSLLMKQYGISEAELPVILVDEKNKLVSVSGKEDIENLLK